MVTESEENLNLNEKPDTKGLPITAEPLLEFTYYRTHRFKITIAKYPF